MSGERDKRLAQLRQAYESGILDEDTYRAAVAALAETTTYQAETGSGAVAQGAEAKAIGRQGVLAAGDVLAPIVTGQWQGNFVTGDPGTDPAALRRAYLHHVLYTSRQLSLAGIDPKAASETESHLNLGAVYTALLTAGASGKDAGELGRLDKEPRRVSALEALNRHQHLVLLGDPGSGKSTFVNFVALCLAGEALGQPDANLELLTAPLPADDESKQAEEKPQPWRHGALLPVRVILRDLAARALPPVGEKATAAHLWQFIEAELVAGSLAEYAKALQQALREQGGLILLDGLDEVPAADDRRVQIKEMVSDFAAAFPRCRLLVTSRTYAYQKQAWRLPHFEEALLAPFSRGQIRRFARRWYTYIAGVRGLDSQDAQGRAELLRRAIFNSDRLLALAERPLLLTLMASLHTWRGGSLPEKREQLYADTVDLLLDWWERPKVLRDAAGQAVVTQPSLAEWLKVDREQVRSLLNRLAYEAHTEQSSLAPESGQETGDIAEAELVDGLLALSQNPDVKPKRLIEYLSERAGLLLSRGVKVYTFPHRTFQEYLAACYLTDDDFPDKLAEVARQEPQRWREVALLAGAKAARGSAASIWTLAEALCYREPEATPAGEADTWGALLAGQALAETADLSRVSERNQVKLARICRWLVHIVESGRLPAVERAQAGRALAHLGDPRPGVSVNPATHLPDIAWGEEVPAGTYTIGGDQEAYNNFKKQQVPISRPYRLARYPITYAQFQCFVKAPDFGDERWWAGIPSNQQDVREGRFPFGNHPREMVSWYQAIAFCRWLSDKLGEEIDLPHEYEWEVAARYPDGQFYPWGNTFDAEKANTGEGDIGNTTAVGIYPNGANEALGLYDLSGNVWEWCRNKYEKPEDAAVDSSGARRVVRGGSWFSFQFFARAASRFIVRPSNRGNNVGFRLVVRRPPSQ